MSVDRIDSGSNHGEDSFSSSLNAPGADGTNTLLVGLNRRNVVDEGSVDLQG